MDVDTQLNDLPATWTDVNGARRSSARTRPSSPDDVIEDWRDAVKDSIAGALVSAAANGDPLLRFQACHPKEATTGWQHFSVVLEIGRVLKRFTKLNDAMLGIIAKAIDPLKARLAVLEAGGVSSDLEKRLQALERRGGIEYRDLWSATESYAKGDAVTRKNNLWIALAPSKGLEPGQSPSFWRLAVRGHCVCQNH